MQRREPPGEQDLARLEAQRRWVREHFAPEARHKYADLHEKLRLLDTILRQRWIEPGETSKLQCLGVTLGDAFVQGEGLSWVMVEDQHGRDPALELVGTTILLFPLTMISKRIENGEAVDVHAMFASVCEKVRALARDGA